MNRIREIRFLATPSERVPFDEWYNSLKDKTTRRVIAGKLRRLQDRRFANFRTAGAGVYALRIFHGPGFRVYFGFENEQTIVVIAGGDKSTQSRDIDRAILLWKEHRNAA